MSRINPQNKDPDIARIMSLEVNAAAKMLAETYPRSWGRMYTRSVDAPGNFYSHRALAVAMTGAIEEAREYDRRGILLESNAPMIAGVLEKYDFPTYYVSSPLIDALRRTQPPDTFTWANIELPFQALAFMLPRGALTEPADDGSNGIILIGVAKLNKDERLNIPTVGITPIDVAEDRICVFWTVAPCGITISDSTFPLTEPMKDLTQWIEEKTPQDRGYTGPSAKFSAVIIALAANLILLMQARADLVEPGSLIRKRSPGKAERRLPTFLGRKYAILRRNESNEASGHFTELGWRAGHFKRQHFGPKNEQVKTIFVDPYIAFTRGLKSEPSNAR